MVDTDEVYIVDTRRSTGNHCCCLLGQTSYLSLEREGERETRAREQRHNGVLQQHATNEHRDCSTRIGTGM